MSVSAYRHQALIQAPIESVWALVGNPGRHPEWFPRVVEVRGDSFGPGDVFVQVTQQPIRAVTTTLEIDRLEDMRELRMHCRDTGTYSRWLLTPARADTFVDAEFGMEPNGLMYRAFDATVGRMYFRRWLEQSLEALGKASGPAPR
jgi:hypothetical protein